MPCVPFVGLLLAHVTGPDLRRVSDPDRVPQIFYQLDKPLAVAGGFHADQRRRRQLLIKALGFPVAMHQLALAGFPSLGFEPTHLLPAGMEITPYNHHCEGSFLPSSLVPQTQDYWIESSLRSYPINVWRFPDVGITTARAMGFQVSVTGKQFPDHRERSGVH